MIYYDSTRWRTLLRLRGSVLPKALLWALPSAALAFGLKYLEELGYVSLDKLDILTQGDVYSGFTYVLGFSLVFRTSNSYTRYWTAATSVHEMASEWSDSCASLIAFASVSHADEGQVHKFKHTVVRLFSLLHAMALSEISAATDDLPILDVQGLSKAQLRVLASGTAQGRKVQVVLSWIKAYITRMADEGLLNVPPPILTRVFQELGSGLVNFHKAQQVVIFPFPFPYTQLNVLLTWVYFFMTPIVITTWRTWPWIAALFTYLAVACTMSLDIIAAELENPFGDDPNDLPLAGLQGDMNMFLTMMLNPAVQDPPQILKTARLDFRQLEFLCKGEMSRMPSGRRLSVHGPLYGPQTMSKADAPLLSARWHGQAAPDGQIMKMHRWLQCFPRSNSPGLERPGLRCTSVRRQSDDGLSMSGELSGGEEQEDDKGQFVTIHTDRDDSSDTPDTNSTGDGGILQPKVEESSISRMTHRTSTLTLRVDGRGSWGAPLVDRHNLDWEPFLEALHEELRAHMDQQLTVQREELKAIRGILHGLPPSPALVPDQEQDDNASDINSNSESEDCCGEEHTFLEPNKSAYLPAPLPAPLLMKIARWPNEQKEQDSVFSSTQAETNFEKGGRRDCFTKYHPSPEQRRMVL